MTVKNSFEPKEPKESPEVMKTALLDALTAALAACDQLGGRGGEQVRKNEFGDTALRVDIKAEEAVIDAFRAQNLPVKVISEEHGEVEVGASKYLVTLDGIDGTKEYPAGRYGTMLAIFDGQNPNYEDYVAVGIMEPGSKRMFYAVKGQGAWVTEEGGQPRRLSTSKDNKLSPQVTRIFVDENFDINHQVFSQRLRGFNIQHRESSAACFADLVSGETDLVLECTRKKNLEFAAAYGLVREAGGAMLTLGGEDLGSRKYLEFGQSSHEPIIAAGSGGLAAQLLEKFKVDYFTKLGLKFREEFRILKDFETSGSKAKKEGWFIGYHSIMEVAAALQISDLIGLSPEERRLLAKAALLHDVGKRREVEAKSSGAADFQKVHESMKAELQAQGVDEKVLQIMEGTSPEFPRILARQAIQPKTPGEAQVYRLQRLMYYIDNFTQTSISRDEEGKKRQSTDIVDWRERNRYFRQRYPDLAKETETINGEELGHFDIEERSNLLVEQEILNGIQDRISEGERQAAQANLPLFIRKKISEDVAMNRHPEL